MYIFCSKKMDDFIRANKPSWIFEMLNPKRIKDLTVQELKDIIKPFFSNARKVGISKMGRDEVVELSKSLFQEMSDLTNQYIDEMEEKYGDILSRNQVLYDELLTKFGVTIKKEKNLTNGRSWYSHYYGKEYYSFSYEQKGEYEGFIEGLKETGYGPHSRISFDKETERLNRLAGELYEIHIGFRLRAIHYCSNLISIDSGGKTDKLPLAIENLENNIKKKELFIKFSEELENGLNNIQATLKQEFGDRYDKWRKEVKTLNN